MTEPTTVAELLAIRAGDVSVGLLYGDDRWTWQEVVEQSRTVARWLAATPGGGPFHIGVLMENSPAYLFTLFGAAQIGATVVGLNPTRRGAELENDIRHTDCRIVVTDAESAHLLAELDLPVTPIVMVDAFGIPPEGEHPQLERLTPDLAPSPETLFILIFTSGSTGAPKAVRMTHRRATAMANTSQWFGPDDVLYSAMPLFHGNALNAIVFPALASGATIALRARFSASQFMPDVRRFGATFFSTVGRALAYILATPESEDDRENAVSYALAPESSPEDMRAFRRRFGIMCLSGYGSSENAIILTPVSGMAREALGVPLEGCEVAIVDPGTGEELPRARFDDGGRLLNASEATGEIVGLNVVDRFEGYYNNPEADGERTRNGWYWSGDLGYRDDDGIFYFAGRTGDWLRVDSENFAAAPVERILARFEPASAAAVYAVPDERTADDQVMVSFELSSNETFDPQAFADFLDAQGDLGTKWAPRYVRITTIPVGATNKADKRPLRLEGWNTDDPIWWRPRHDDPYRPFTPEDRAGLEEIALIHRRDLSRPA